MNKMGWLLFGLVLSGIFTLPQVFSLNVTAPASAHRERALWVTEADGFLPESETKTILRQLEIPIVKSYTVRRNEWLEKIAQELGVPALSIRSTNNLEDPRLRPNQRILIQNKKGMVHLSRGNESLEAVVKSYEKLGGTREKILASNPMDEILTLENGQWILKEGIKLWIPDARRSYPFLARPVQWLRISSRFGVRRHPITRRKRWHEGYDLVARYGAPVYASQTGVISFAGWSGGYGNVVDIRHSQITTRYGHLSEILVSDGQRVKKRQIIGRVGSTGLSTGPHLHFEVRRNSDGKSLVPGRYLY
ncbi:MAG: M23 family metallopeptidase [Elusimicrobia bacterium]|nr:M23 family metallopeptidase [Elusimicrobiota bacterium]